MQQQSSKSISSYERLHSYISGVFPGVLTCILIGLAAAYLSDHYGGPLMLYALLFGIALNFLSEEGACRAGIDLSAKTILRAGVALLGVRITYNQVVDLGWQPLALVLISVSATIIFGWLLSRMMGLSREQGLLSGGAVAICGASAAMALSSVMPKNEESERTTILTVVCVTALSTLAMVLYPAIVSALELNDFAASLFLGSTIHDVAQVVGAGYMLSPEIGDMSALVKLMRVAMLVPVVLIFSLFIYKRAKDDPATRRAEHVPLFLVGFIALVAINSFGFIPQAAVEGMSSLSKACLVTAIAALGVKTSFKKLLVVGWRPVALMVAETIFLCTLSLTFIYIFLY